IYMIVARFGRVALGCPDEGVWAYVSVATRGGALKLPSFARLPRRGRLGLRGVWQRTRWAQDCRALLGCPDEGVWAYVGCGNARRHGSRLPSFARLSR